MNRYSDYSVSVYDPMSFEDIARVPMMKRAQHDASQAKLEADLSEINKIDSLDVHQPEAMRIKSDLLKQINSQAEQLAREGFTNNTTPALLKTNREIQDLFAPTGRAGQINAAKKVYIENRKDFLDDATKTKGWSMERALNAWTDFSSINLYTGYDSGNNITNIGLLGAPKKIETLDKLKSVHDLLGEQVVGEMKASGYGFAAGPNGSTIMIDNSGRRIETSNKPNLQSALNLLDNQFNEKEWSDSRKFEGANSDSVKSQVINGVNSMLKTGIVDNRSENTQYIDAKESSGKPEDPDYEGVNVETVNVTKNSDLLKNLKHWLLL